MANPNDWLWPTGLSRMDKAARYARLALARHLWHLSNEEYSQQVSEFNIPLIHQTQLETMVLRVDQAWKNPGRCRISSLWCHIP
jgi:hypothetical protein